MQRLFLFLLVALPWWGYLALSGGVAWLGYEAYQKERVELAERQAQAMAPPPEVVDLSQFDLSRDVAPADELHVRGWINTDYSYELIKRTNGVRTGTRFMYVLFGSEDDAASKQARAAVVMTEADKDRFVDDIFDHVVGFNAQGPVIALNGFRGSGDGYASMVSEALAEKGLTRAPDFVFVEPFLDGRQAALTATGEPLRVLGVFLLFAAAFAMAGLAKLVFSRRRAGAAVMPRRGKAAPARDPFANGPIAGEGRPAPSSSSAARPLSPIYPGEVMADSVTDDTPLGRIKRREQEALKAQLAGEQTAPMSPSAVSAFAAQSGQASVAIPPRKTARVGLFPKLLGGIVVLIVIGQVVPGASSLPLLIFPLAFIGSIWFGLFKLSAVLGKGVDAIRGVEDQTTTLARVGGLNITSTRKVRRDGGSVLGGLFRGKGARAADPLDKLAAQVRSGR